MWVLSFEFVRVRSLENFNDVSEDDLKLQTRVYVDY
jgi:hypothetical protein